MDRAPSELVHFATRHPADGRALRYHFDEFILELVPTLAERMAERPALRRTREFVPPQLLRLYVEQALYVELLNVARAVFRSRFAGSQGLLAGQVRVPAELAGLLGALLPDCATWLAPSRAFALRSGLSRWRRRLRELVDQRVAAPGATAAAGTIAVEMVEGADLSRKSDVFWLAAGRRAPARGLFVLEPSNRSLVDVRRSLEAVRRLGSRVVALDTRMTAGGEIPFWRPRALPAWSRELDRALPRASDGPDRWLRRALSLLARRAGYWESFYREHGVVAVQHFTELSTEGAVKRIAVDRVGGMEFGKMRSQFFERASPAFHFQHEVAFVWHRNVAPCLRSSRTETRALVETGYVYEHLRVAAADEAKKLRANLARSVSTIAVVYDNHPHLFGHASFDDLERFYRAVLRLSERHPGLGLIVKSKKPHVLRDIPAIARELAALAGTGRCLVLDEPFTSVVPTALASDLALGFPASTAACEAALAGCKVLMYEPGRASGHPWAKNGLGIMFSELADFERAADDAVRHCAAGERGMPRERLLELDPFLDGNAAHRAATFIQTFLAARERGLDKPASLAAALETCGDHAVALDAG